MTSPVTLALERHAGPAALMRPAKELKVRKQSEHLFSRSICSNPAFCSSSHRVVSVANSCCIDLACSPNQPSIKDQTARCFACQSVAFSFFRQLQEKAAFFLPTQPPCAEVLLRVLPGSGDLEAKLLGLLCLDGPLFSSGDVLGLNSHNASAPPPLHLGIIIELRLEVVDQSIQLLLILRLH